MADNLEDYDDTLQVLDDNHSLRREPCYIPHLQRIKDRNFYPEIPETFIVEVPLDEIVEWGNSRGDDLARNAEKDTMRYHKIFSGAIDDAIARLTASGNSSHNNNGLRDTIDILHEHRLAQEEQNRATTNQNSAGGIVNPFEGNNAIDQEEPGDQPQPGGATNDFPPILMRRYELRILPRGRRGTLPPFVNQHVKGSVESPAGASLRNIRASNMGRLVTIRGMVVRTSDVKPCCIVATYSCDACGIEAYDVVGDRREFMPPKKCPSPTCRNAKGQETLHLETRGSKFIKFQEWKLQELPSQVPMGHVPRSMSLYVRGEWTRTANPGDVVTVDGVFLPQKVGSGYRALRAGLISTTFLQVQHVVVHQKSFDESLLDSLGAAESAKLDQEMTEVATSEDPVGLLSSCIAPEIFGHEDIKRALLLQLVGGCTRKLKDGMRIRGDINICLMGDPGVAKSQLLKHVSSIAPRGVYTTGKGSSGVGLTAAITKDLATGELALEGGALVLADRGICCIDEFDKMEEADRTAIHEVMEQQTVSIAKAGIVATLNARAAVLAAANPLYGRYNRSKSLSENVNLPNSLLSRFDLLFLVLDVADVDKDMALARHVTFVHQNEGLEKNAESDSEDGNGLVDTASTPESSDKPKILSPQVLREYIARARRHHPVMPPEVAPYVVEAYVSLRMEDRPGHGSKQNDQTVMTARQLLSILRLSQALARLRFSDFVAREDVDEAIRLTHMSKSSLLDHDTKDGEPRREDVMSRIFNVLRDYASSSNSSQIELKLAEAMILRKGFTVQQLQSCLSEYEALQVIQINRTKTHLYFIGGS